MTDDQRLLS